MSEQRPFPFLHFPSLPFKLSNGGIHGLLCPLPSLLKGLLTAENEIFMSPALIFHSLSQLLIIEPWDLNAFFTILFSPSVSHSIFFSHQACSAPFYDLFGHSPFFLFLFLFLFLSFLSFYLGFFYLFFIFLFFFFFLIWIVLLLTFLSLLLLCSLFLVISFLHSSSTITVHSRTTRHPKEERPQQEEEAEGEAFKSPLDEVEEELRVPPFRSPTFTMRLTRSNLR